MQILQDLPQAVRADERQRPVQAYASSHESGLSRCGRRTLWLVTSSAFMGVLVFLALCSFIYGSYYMREPVALLQARGCNPKLPQTNATAEAWVFSLRHGICNADAGMNTFYKCISHPSGSLTGGRRANNGLGVVYGGGRRLDHDTDGVDCDAYWNTCMRFENSTFWANADNPDSYGNANGLQGQQKRPDATPDEMQPTFVRGAEKVVRGTRELRAAMWLLALCALAPMADLGIALARPSIEKHCRWVRGNRNGADYELAQLPLPLPLPPRPRQEQQEQQQQQQQERAQPPTIIAAPAVTLSAFDDHNCASAASAYHDAAMATVAAETEQIPAAPTFEDEEREEAEAEAETEAVEEAILPPLHTRWLHFAKQLLLEGEKNHSCFITACLLQLVTFILIIKGVTSMHRTAQWEPAMWTSVSANTYFGVCTDVNIKSLRTGTLVVMLLSSALISTGGALMLWAKKSQGRRQLVIAQAAPTP